MAAAAGLCRSAVTGISWAHGVLNVSGESAPPPMGTPADPIYRLTPSACSEVARPCMPVREPCAVSTPRRSCGRAMSGAGTMRAAAAQSENRVRRRSHRRRRGFAAALHDDPDAHMIPVRPSHNPSRQPSSARHAPEARFSGREREVPRP